MKKIGSLMLAATMLISLAACSSKTSNTNETHAPSNQQTNADSTQDSANESKAIDGTAAINGTMIPGSIYYLYIEDGKEPVIKGVTLSGNRAGSEEFNSKKPATEGIRDIFELNEYIAVDFETSVSVTEGIQLFVLKHTDDFSTYINNNYTDNPQILASASLFKPEDGSGSWGEFYLNPENAEPGYYDFVFVYDNKPIAVMEVKMYAEEQLAGKSDSELNDLMKSI